MYSNAPLVGSWLSDVIGWGEDVLGGGAGGSGGGPPGYGGHPGTNPAQSAPVYYQVDGDTSAYVTQAQADDLDTLLAWKQYVRETGAVPTVMPIPRADAGEPAIRINGPGTNHPEFQPPYTYTLAPDDVRAAYARLRASEATAVLLGSVIPSEVVGINAAVQKTLSFLDQYKYWIAAGVVGVVIFARE